MVAPRLACAAPCIFIPSRASVKLEPLITVTRDVPGRRPAGRERPWVSLGRDGPPCQRPHRCQDRRSPHRTRLGGGGGQARRDPPVLGGIDVSTAQRDVALRPPEDCWPVSNEAVGLTRLVERRRAGQPTLVGLEATGGLAVPVPGARADAGRPGVVVTPRHARDVATAPGRLATTARRDARGVAHVAAALRPPPQPRPEAPAHAVSALLTRRRQVGQLLTAARRRLQTAPQPSRADSQAHRTWVTRRWARTAADVAAAMHASPWWRAKAARLQRTPGVGPLRSRPLGAEVPERGGLHRPELAALRGGAPLHRARGPVRGTRAVWGGRAPVRAVLSRSTLAAGRHHPLLTAFDARRRAVGHAPQGALTAWMRQLWTLLNARRTHQTPWQENEAHHA